MSNAVFAISDGTTRISLLNKGSGVVLEEWQPARPQPREHRQQSPFAPGSQVVYRTWEDVIETLSFAAVGTSQDVIIHECQELDRLLLAAVDYWASDWPTTPVWIEARGSEETNARYAVVKSYRPLSDSNPFAQPFYSHFRRKGMPGLTLVIEHGIWMDCLPWLEDSPPGAYTAPPRRNYLRVLSQQTWNGVTYGLPRERYPYWVAAPWPIWPALPRGPYVANKHNKANLSHIFWYDAAPGPAWSGNLIGAALPHDLLPAVPAVNDIVYFGCDTTVGDSGPFDNVVLDITAAAPAVTGTWQYWNGAAWAAIPAIVDASGALSAWIPCVTGLCSAYFPPPSDWTTTAVKGVTG